MNCPICNNPVPDELRDQPKSPYPFCCERCKLIDLGRWLDGKYQVPVIADDESHDGDVGGDIDEWEPQKEK